MNKVLIDGIYTRHNKPITICTSCAKTYCTNQKHRKRVCVNAGFWYKTKQKYDKKIMGKIRIVLMIRKMDRQINEDIK